MWILGTVQSAVLSLRHEATSSRGSDEESEETRMSQSRLLTRTTRQGPRSVWKRRVIASLSMLTLGVSGIAGAAWADPAGPQSDVEPVVGSSPFDSEDVPSGDSSSASTTEPDAEGTTSDELGAAQGLGAEAESDSADDTTVTPQESSEPAVDSNAGDASASDEAGEDASGEEAAIDPGAPRMAPAALRGTIPLEVLAQAANHHSTDGTGGDIRYGSAAAGTVSGKIPNPGGGADSTAFVGPGSMVYSAHGRGQKCLKKVAGKCVLYEGQEDGELNLNVKSAVGFAPRQVGSVDVGKKFNLGYFVHVNNPIVGSGGNDGQHYAAELKIKLTLNGVEKPLSFPWTIHETPNNWADPRDILNFTSTVAPVSFESGNLNYTLTIHGFTQNSGTSCPAELAEGTPLSERFITVEGQKTYGCLWASIEQVRKVTIEKKVEKAPGMVGEIPDTTFGFTATGDLSNLWGTGGTFSLKPTEATPATEENANGYNTGKELKITEDTLGANWSLKSLSCKDKDGQGDPIGSISGGTLTLEKKLAEADPDKVPIRCTYTNLYTPPATITLLKEVSSGTADIWNWTLSATHGAGGVIGDSGVFGDVTPNQEYALSETPKAGFTEAEQYELEEWSCSADQGQLTFDADAKTVTPKPGQKVTCTARNRLKSATLTLVKKINVPADAPDWAKKATEKDWSLKANGPTSIEGISGDSAVTNAKIQPGNYTLSETAKPAGITGGLPAAAYAESWECLDAAGARVEKDPTGAFPFAAGQTYTCTATNTLRTGGAKWKKTGEGEPLTGSEWTLTLNGVPGATVGVSSATSEFAVENLPVGTYTLHESKVPAGYLAHDDLQIEIKEGETNLDHYTAPIDNKKRPVPRLPLTGGLGEDWFVILAGGAGGIAALLAVAARRRKRSAS